MVDFNNETTIGTPSIDVTRIILLQYRYDTREALEQYMRASFSGVAGNISVLRARLLTWFFEMRPMLKRKLKKDKYEELLNKVTGEEIEENEIIEIISLLDDELDKIMVTRIDIREQYDTARVEKENKKKKL